MNSRPFFSVIVPTYNRPQHVAPLLDSVLAQNFADWEVVIGEDCSPSRDAVRAIVDDYAKRTNGRVRCVLHDATFGYDKNLRTLIKEARGRYVFVMGDDDYVAPNALAAAAAAIARHPNMGLLLRAFAWFVGEPDNVIRTTRYYREECVFAPGRDAIIASYRRLVCMSGLILDRDLAASFDTDRWDGSLFYQHWVTANVLMEREAVYIPDLMVHFRLGSPRNFGTAAAEQGLYTPGKEPPDTTYKGIYYHFEIAKAIEQERGVRIVDDLLRDYANYAFPQAAMHSRRPLREYYDFYRNLGRLGLNRFASFHAWFIGVRLLGARNVERLLDLVRRVAGYTPNITRGLHPRRARPMRARTAARPSGGSPAVSTE